MKTFRIITAAFLVLTFAASLMINGVMDLLLNNVKIVDTEVKQESSVAEKTIEVDKVAEKTNAQSKPKVDSESQKKEEEKKKAEEKKKEEERKKAEEQKKKEEAEKKRMEWRSSQDEKIFTSDHMVDDSWFDDALFVGDSVTNALAAYSEANGRFGNADFLCIASLGYNSSLWDLDDPYNVHPLWKGKKVTVDEGVKLSGKHKIFIMFGMNDVGKGIEQSIEAMKELTDRILRKSPGVEIYIQGGTPMLPEAESDILSNELMRQLNQGIKEVCDERGFHFIDITPAVCDQDGALIFDYCMDPDDMGIHLNYEGCERWVNYLMAHVLDSENSGVGVYTPQPSEDYNEEEEYTFIDDTSLEEESESDDESSEEYEEDYSDTEESTEDGNGEEEYYYY